MTTKTASLPALAGRLALRGTGIERPVHAIHISRVCESRDAAQTHHGLFEEALDCLLFCEVLVDNESLGLHPFRILVLKVPQDGLNYNRRFGERNEVTDRNASSGWPGNHQRAYHTKVRRQIHSKTKLTLTDVPRL